jgi:SAM-dependent methyltransferase
MKIETLLTNKNDYQSGWIEAYERKKDGYLWKEEPIEFLSRHISLFKKYNIYKILDVNCGDGRNCLYLAENDFFVTGIDISPIALQKTLVTSNERNINSLCLVKANAEELPCPFPMHFFDAIVCLDVFGQLSNIKRTVTGFNEVLKDDGLLLTNLYTPDDETFGKGTKVEENTFLYKKTLFRFFTESDIQKIFSNFKILEIEKLCWEDPPHPGYRDTKHTHESYVVLLKNIKKKS